MNDANRNELKPVVVPGLGNVKKIAAANSGICALINDGSVSCWGVNNHGQIGPDVNSPAPFFSVPYLLPEQGLTDVDIGGRHLCALKSDKAFCRGDNSVGELGNGSVGENQSLLGEVSGFSGLAKQIEAGELLSCAVSGSGDVFVGDMEGSTRWDSWAIGIILLCRLK